jgi:hypothetical protein
MLLPTKLTWSKYFSCTRCLAAHIRHGCSSFAGNSSWFTTMLCVSIPHFVSSCTNLSVSYSDRNSAIHTHTNVVCSCKAKNFLSAYSFFVAVITLITQLYYFPTHILKSGILQLLNAFHADFYLKKPSVINNQINTEIRNIFQHFCLFSWSKYPNCK